jgi:hypothetical protein
MNSASCNYQWRYGDSLVCNYIPSASIPPTHTVAISTALPTSSVKRTRATRQEVRQKPSLLQAFHALIKARNLLLDVLSTE